MKNFTDMIKEAMAQGMTADEVAKQFTEAMNKATKVDAVEDFCKKVYETTYINPERLTVEQAADILVAVIARGKNLDEKDIEDMRKTMKECAYFAAGIFGKSDDEMIDFILKEVAKLFN